MQSQQLQKKKLPDKPGVYFFCRYKDDKKGNKTKVVLYVGKATSIRNRVKSYFTHDIAIKRSVLIEKMVNEATHITWQETDSVLEALILEASFIKKYQPYYNSREKDNKSYNYVLITHEDFPRILVVRGRELDNPLLATDFKLLTRSSFGPFPHGAQLQEAMKIIRKIFPYRDNKCRPFDREKGKARPCFNRQIGLCPGVCTGEISTKDYTKVIRNIKLFFAGKKKILVKTLEKEMKLHSKKLEFEKAGKIKQTIFALQHINDVAMLKGDIQGLALNPKKGKTLDANIRIEAYDIAHMSGASLVGVMTVVENGEVKKSGYRKFKIKGTFGGPARPHDSSGAGGSIDDTGNLEEILRRRFAHTEWSMPNIVVMDGGVAQMNIARKVLDELGIKNLEVVAVTKDERHKAREIRGNADVVGKHKSYILLANSEAHRFAIGFHRKLRNKTLLL